MLLKKVKEGNQTAFEKLILQYEKQVYNIAYRMFYNEADAKDISQEVFLRIYQKIHTFEETSKFSTWLYRITINICIDELRKRKGKETYSIDETYKQEDGEMTKQYKLQEQGPEEVFLQKERIEALHKGIQKLPEDYKAVIILRDLQNFSYQEIADILSCSLGTVKSRISRGRIQLKNILLEQTRELFDHPNV
ncbi:MAG: sigma-70 family RNA polymerase sigma factor [Epulopiscium sp.]|nr:sigma-70 family RNA polymerase sigma factor [Candidatus Epulonipiscium sp.]